ncbi:MAG: hypothetical protein ACFNL2_10915, partial [Tannerella forsythia]|uniref:hypothetical protein n=1 Tax=Tannerella forsythia TaxID=28112 RepID=UPI003605EC96
TDQHLNTCRAVSLRHFFSFCGKGCLRLDNRLSACYLKPVKIMKIMDKTSALLLMFAEALEVFLA